VPAPPPPVSPKRTVWRALLAVTTASLLVCLALVSAGCSNGASDHAVGSPATTAPASAATAATLSTTTTISLPPSSQGLSPAEADALEAQLSAIQKQLDSISLPSDDDFKGIESQVK
jgi:hypothetical protein